MSNSIQISEQKPTILDVLPMIVSYYGNNPAGGCLHLILDDGNIGDDSVRFCLNQAINCGDVDAEYIAKKLLLMSKTQRRKLYRCPKLH